MYLPFFKRQMLCHNTLNVYNVIREFRNFEIFLYVYFEIGLIVALFPWNCCIRVIDCASFWRLTFINKIESNFPVKFTSCRLNLNKYAILYRPEVLQYKSLYPLHNVPFKLHKYAIIITNSFHLKTSILMYG